MKATEILGSEHRIIEEVLDCLEAMIFQANAAGKLDGHSATEAIGFFRGFADQCHHGKEEAHLFPAMEGRGFPHDAGPIGVMLQEHAAGRHYVKEMSESTAAASRGDAGALRRFSDAGRAYATLLREHIQKEDHCLFSMADQALSEGDQEALLKAFERVEHEQGRDKHQGFLDVASKLGEKFGVRKKATGHICCCQH